MKAYRYLEDFATADIAFEARSEGLAQLFRAAADATMNVMVEDLESIRPVVERRVDLENTDVEMLLFDLLQELIYFKDAEQLVLRLRDVDVREQQGRFLLSARAAGEKLDPGRHEQGVDVKAVTLHHFTVKKVDDGWKALVILDI